MKKVFLIFISSFVIMGSLLPESVADTLISFWQGYYVDKVEQGEGVSELADVDVFPAYEGQAMYIDFMIAWNPPERILGAVSAAYSINKKQFSFSFADGSGNQGQGTFSRHGEKFVLHLEIVQKSSSGAMISNLYGDYDLVKKETKGRSDRHPWSLGRVRPNNR